MRRDFLRNIFRFREKGAVFKFLVISGFITSLWVFSLILFLKGFNFLKGFPGIGDMITERLLYLIFGVVFFMLIISTAIVSYSTHYKSEELPFLFAMPLGAGTVFIYKSFHAIFLSSWASIFLISPLLIAYGITKSLSAGFYIVSMFFFPLLVIISGVVGIVLTMFLIGHIRGKIAKTLFFLSIVTLIIVTFLVFYFRKAPEPTDNILLITFNRLLHHTRIFLFPLLPSYWISEGLVSFTKSQMKEVVFYLLLLLSTTLVCMIFVESLARRIYRDTWFRSQNAGKGGRSTMVEKVDLLSSVLRFIPRNLLSFVIKDIKTFLRDPQQWSQALIFLGLLFAYIINLRKMPYDIEAIFWKKLILFLNITSIITILAMLSTRFAFPLVSFEGKRFWITMLAPLSLRELILEKFWVTGTGLFVMGEILIISLNVMLKTSLSILFLSSAVVASVSFAFAGLSIGIGALFPDFREENFAKISSGFGGTLLLVLSILYICAIIAFTCVPVFVVKETSRFFYLSSFAAGLAIVSISLFCAMFPISLGIKSLKRRDF